jgi:hypothetical protein
MMIVVMIMAVAVVVLMDEFVMPALPVPAGRSP